MRSFSLETKLKSEGNRRCLLDGVAAGLAHYDDHLSAVVARLLDSGCRVAERDSATFVCIEMLGGLGEKAGLGGRDSSARQSRAGSVPAAVGGAGGARAAGGVDLEERRDGHQRAAGAAAGGGAPDSALYFNRASVLGEGHKLKPGWTLGR